MRAVPGWFWVLVALDLVCVGLLLWVVLSVMHGLTFGGPDTTSWGRYAQVVLLVGGVLLAATAVLAGVGWMLIARGWRLAGLALTAVPAVALPAWVFGGGLR